MSSPTAYLLPVGTNAYDEPRYVPDLAAIGTFPLTNIPRYLFRALSSHSRGYSGPPEFICAARYAKTPPPPIRQSSTFINDTYNHLRATRKIGKKLFDSPYISFSSSLLLVLAWACRKLEYQEASITIAIIDTTKVTSQALLPASLLVSIANACLKKDQRPLIEDGYDGEYMAYDTLSFTVASNGIHTFTLLEILQQTKLTTFLPTLRKVKLDKNWHAQLKDLRSTIYKLHQPLNVEKQRILVEIALGFPDNFVLPVLVKLLGMGGLQMHTDALLQETIMSGTREFACGIAGYRDFIPQTLDERAPLRSPDQLPELKEEYAILRFMHAEFTNQQKFWEPKLAALRGSLNSLGVLLNRQATRSQKSVENRILRGYFNQLQDRGVRLDSMAYSRLEEDVVQECVKAVREWEEELAGCVSVDVSVQIGEPLLAKFASGGKREREEEGDETDQSATKRIKL